MKGKVIQTTEVILCLNEEEAKWLKSFCQNPDHIKDFTIDDLSRKRFEDLFNAIKI